MNKKSFKFGFHVYLKYFDEINRECFKLCKTMYLRCPVLRIKYLFYVALSCCQDKWSLLVICLHISLTKSFFVCFVLLISIERLSQSQLHGLALLFLNKKERGAYIIGMQNFITLSQKARHLKCCSRSSAYIDKGYGLSRDLNRYQRIKTTLHIK